VNIDLLLTAQNLPGLVCDKPLMSPVAGIIFDAATTQLTLELTNLETVETNIPVEEGFAQTLFYTDMLQFGLIYDGQVQDSRQIPLMVINDPHFAQDYSRAPARATQSVLQFESFMKSAITGQPIHRDDLGDEDALDGVMGGLNGAMVEFAPHLSRQKTMEAAPKAAPRMAGPGPSGMGGGGGGGYVPPARTEED
jgi:hypothetical protein